MDKIRIGCLTPAFWEAHKWAEMLHHPCILGGPQQRGQNQSGPTSGRKCYITPAFSGVPNKGDKIKGGPQVGGNATSPLHSRGSPKKGGQNQNWMPNPCLLGGPQVGGNATSPLHSRGSPTKGTKSKQKKSKKNQNKNCPMVCLILPTALQIAPSGVRIQDLQLQRHCFTTRVWPISDIPLHRGGIHILLPSASPPRRESTPSNTHPK